MIQLPENKVYHYTPEELNIGEGSVYTFFIDEAGYKWIGTGWGLYKAAPASFHFEKVEEVGFDWIFDAFQDKDGMIWFASMGNGLWKRDPGKNSFKKYTYVAWAVCRCGHYPALHRPHCRARRTGKVESLMKRSFAGKGVCPRAVGVRDAPHRSIQRKTVFCIPRGLHR